MKDFKTAATAFFITAGFFCSILCMVGIFLLPAQVGTVEIPADETVSGIDYSKAPDPISIKVISATGSGAVLYFGFRTVTLDVYLFENSDDMTELKTDYYVELSDGFPGKFCDRIGGVAIENSGETENFFGAALEQYSTNNLNREKMLKISSAFFEKIAKTGLSSEDFKFIMNNVKTDLNFPTCYDMMEYLPELFENCNFR